MDDCWDAWQELVNKSKKLKEMYKELGEGIQGQVVYLKSSFRKQILGMLLCSGVGNLAGTGAFMGT